MTLVCVKGYVLGRNVDLRDERKSLRACSSAPHMRLMSVDTIWNSAADEKGREKTIRYKIKI